MSILTAIKAGKIITKIKNNKQSILFFILVIFLLAAIFNHFRLQDKLIDAEKTVVLYEQANKELALSIAEIEQDMQRKNELLEKRLKSLLKQNRELDSKIKKLKAIPNEKCLDSAITYDVIRLFRKSGN